MENLEAGSNASGPKTKSIAEALSVLEEAARENSEEIQNLLKDDYARVRDALKNLKPELSSSLRQLREASMEGVLHAKDRLVGTSRDVARQFDRSVHQSPWYFIGGIAAIAGVFGFALGQKFRD